ncbi:MAG: OmpH family outer membrane protein [Bilophila wadsworthia]
MYIQGEEYVQSIVPRSCGLFADGGFRFRRHENRRVQLSGRCYGQRRSQGRPAEAAVAVRRREGAAKKQAKDLQSKGEALQAQVAKMSAKEREDKQMEFLRLRRAFEEKSRNFARKVENTENQIRQSMAQQIYDAATTIAKQQKLDLILDAAAGSVMYATPSLDITKPVLAEVNRLWKAGGSKFPEPNTGKK